MRKILTTILDMYLNGDGGDGPAQREVERLRGRLASVRAELASALEYNNGLANNEIQNLRTDLKREEGRAREHGGKEADALRRELSVARALIETLKDELGEARAERDHALERPQYTVSTSTDGVEWETTDTGPGYGELGAALTERDEALEAVARLEALLTDTVRERDVVKRQAESLRQQPAVHLAKLHKAKSEVGSLRDQLAKAKLARQAELEQSYQAKCEELKHFKVASAAELAHSHEERDMWQAHVEGLEADDAGVEQLQGALLLARGGLVKARELALASEDALQMFFTLRATSRDQQEWYPVRGELIGKFRKVARLAEVMRLLRS